MKEMVCGKFLLLLNNMRRFSMLVWSSVNHKLINFQVSLYNCVICIPFLISSSNCKKFSLKIWWVDQSLLDLAIRLLRTFWAWKKKLFKHFFWVYIKCISKILVYLGFNSKRVCILAYNILTPLQPGRLSTPPLSIRQKMKSKKIKMC